MGSRSIHHLEPGGVIMVEPWFTPSTFYPGRIYVNTAEAEGVKVCRMSHSTVQDSISRLEFEYLIGRESGIARASETHELGLFTVEEMKDSFDTVGLSVEYEPDGISGRGLYIAKARRE